MSYLGNYMIISYDVFFITPREEPLFQLVPGHGFYCKKKIWNSFWLATFVCVCVMQHLLFLV